MPSGATFDLLAMARRVQRRTRRVRRLRAGGWLGLSALGALRGGALGVALVVWAGNRAVRAATGRSLVEHLIDPRQGPPLGGERDAVDEASWESFPASDPPAYSGR